MWAESTRLDENGRIVPRGRRYVESKSAGMMHRNNDKLIETRSIAVDAQDAAFSGDLELHPALPAVPPRRKVG
jgi:hypothetical protein